MAYDISKMILKKQKEVLLRQKEKDELVKLEQFRRTELILKEIVTKLDNYDYLIHGSVVLVFLEKVDILLSGFEINQVVNPYNLCVMEIDEPLLFINNGNPMYCLPLFPKDWLTRYFYLFGKVNPKYEKHSFDNIFSCYATEIFDYVFIRDENDFYGYINNSNNSLGKRYRNLLSYGLKLSMFWDRGEAKEFLIKMANQYLELKKKERERDDKNTDEF